MHVDRVPLNGVENQVILDDEIAISQTKESFFVGNTPQVGILGEAGETSFYAGSEFISCQRTVGGDVRHDFRQVILSNSEEPDGVLRSIHGSASGGPSSPGQVADPYPLLLAVPERRQVC